MLRTGASGGIGAAVAERFARAGDRVAVHYERNRRGAEARLRALPGDGYTLRSGDADDPSAASSVVASAIDQLGRVDVLVCNAEVAPSAALAPGFVATPRRVAKLENAENDALRSQSPLGRVGDPEEMTEAVFWLPSPHTGWCSGAILDANGASNLRT